MFELNYFGLGYNDEFEITHNKGSKIISDNKKAKKTPNSSMRITYDKQNSHRNISDGFMTITNKENSEFTGAFIP